MCDISFTAHVMFGSTRSTVKGPQRVGGMGFKRPPKKPVPDALATISRAGRPADSNVSSQLILDNSAKHPRRQRQGGLAHEHGRQR